MRAIASFARRQRILFVAVFTALVLINAWLVFELVRQDTATVSIETTVAIVIGSVAAFALYLVWRNPVATVTATACTPSLRFALATHQAGHIVASFLDDPNRIRKVYLHGPCATRASLVPLRTQQSMRSELSIKLAGVASEEIFTGEASGFAAEDLAAATRLGADMVGRLGMGSSLVSMAAERRRSRFLTRVLEDARTRKELEGLLRDAKRESMRLMLEHRHLIIAIRDELMRKEQLNTTEIQLLFDQARSRKDDADEVLVDLRSASERTRPIIELARN